MHRLQPALGGGVLVQAATARLGGQQLLIDHLVQHATEQLGLDVQRLALADQALSHRLAAHVRGPDRTVRHPRHHQIILFGRGFRVAAPAGGRQRQGQQGRRQHGPHGSEKGARKTHQALRPKGAKGAKN
ncbi:hypothetical protein D3C85_1420980 [compost metagenome]